MLPGRGPTIELVLYAAKPGIGQEEMIAAVEATYMILREFPGYLQRELAYSAESGMWLDLVHWEDRESALAAAARFGSHPVAQRLMEAIDFKRMTMHHLDSQLVDRAPLLLVR
jgi:hypothetical protein